MMNGCLEATCYAGFEPASHSSHENAIADRTSFVRNNEVFHPLRRSKRAAFTLAEVLITLGIIGVVAVLVIPNWVQNYQKQVTVQRLKEAFSIFSQVVNTSVNENGPIASWQYANSMELGEKYLLPYMKGVQTATIYSPMRTLSSGDANGGKNVAANTSYLTWPRHKGAMSGEPIYLMPNGMLVHFAKANDARFDYAHIIVDINGYKSPNIMGIDGFRFTLDNKTSILKPTERALYNECVRDGNWPYYR